MVGNIFPFEGLIEIALVSRGVHQSKDVSVGSYEHFLKIGGKGEVIQGESLQDNEELC